MWNNLLKLKNFLIMVGKYDDLLMFHENHIEFCPAMDINSIREYIQYKYLPVWTEILDSETGIPLINKYSGQKITAVGEWNNQRNIDKF